MPFEHAYSQWDTLHTSFDRNGICGNETIVGSNPNVFCLRESCGQRSGMVVGSKRRGWHFILPCEFATYFQGQNVEESEM